MILLPRFRFLVLQENHSQEPGHVTDHLPHVVCPPLGLPFFYIYLDEICLTLSFSGTSYVRDFAISMI